GRGIGRSHCHALAQLGAAVVVNDPGVGRDGTGRPEGAGLAATVVEEIERAGGTAIAHTGSVTIWEEAAAVANFTVAVALEADRYGVTANAISPLAISRMTEQLLADRADDPALDPGRSSAVVAWLQSVESAWLTGQILRINGDQLTRIHGFTEGPSRYHAADGVALQFSEIGNAVRWLWDTFPRGLAGPLAQR
ncbi:MAG TPA: short-chain dehydrogenase, partial [Mycobacterium sp.]